MGYSAKQKILKKRVTGAKKLAKHLKSMNDDSSKVLMKGAKAGGKIALEDAKLHCPVDTGALRSSLKISEDKRTATKATVKLDYDKSLKYGTYVELGSRGRRGNPFLRNAVDNNIDKINERIIDEIAKAIGRKL